MSPLRLFFCLLLPCLFCLNPVYGTGIHYTIHERFKNKQGDKLTSEIDLREAYQILRGATEFVLGTFGLKEGRGMPERKYNRVVLITQSFEEHHMPSYAHAVASTTRNVIVLNSDYLQHYDGDVKEEFSGILYHESTRVWQNDGNRQAPTGLLNGIADYVRMKAGFASKGWPSRGSGSNWNQGYAVTAYFLEYCDSLRPGGNFVRELNAMMKYSYSDEYFVRLLGKSVYELWSNYLNSYRHDVGEARLTSDESSLPRKEPTITGVRPANVVALPRLSDEAYELAKGYRQRSEEASRDEGEAMWGCLADILRGLMRMVTQEAAASSYKFNKEGHEIA